MNFLSLSEKLADEKAAVKFFQSHGIISEEKECSKKHQMKLQFGKQIRWRCYIKECREECGIRIGTWFQDTRLSFRTAAFFIYNWGEERTSVDFCKKELQMGYCTTVDWNNYLREVCLFMKGKDQNPIGGKGKTVEVDETLFVRRKNHCGRMLQQQWCFGGICRETKHCFVEAVPDRSSATLLEVLKRRVAPETLIISDMWKGYSQVGDSGFEHLQVNHKYHFVDPLTNAHTQSIERVWRSVKERNRRHNGTHRSMLNGYMYEFTWRKRNKGKEFDAILRDIASFNSFLNE
ncbi:Transposase, ISXO2-like domain-containing protein [Strongyloides ratti]|uniref:Transposase, ISXO2-like domain-containing protein n=1 Tax=Strongyloides ratti TaxID=34506 RepID=A0A090KRD4_STRRB|nr:Transposase, ISXO2-like domain-containing protein [Strongyloides ratti]CEF60069.2 Transposase, ISXO2-like domain-containing protein [Strongyloides ratti]